MPLVLGPVTLVRLATLALGAVASDIVARLVPAYVDLLKQLKVRLERSLVMYPVCEKAKGRGMCAGPQSSLQI